MATSRLYNSNIQKGPQLKNAGPYPTVEIEGVPITRHFWCYYKSGLKLGLPMEPDELVDGFVIKLGGKRYMFAGGITPFNKHANMLLLQNKFIANRLLERAKIPVPAAITVEKSGFSKSVLKQATADIRFPVVLKPFSWSRMGIDVICKIPDLETLYTLCCKHFKQYQQIFIEEFHGNMQSYRVFMFKNKVLGVVARYGATITGNGFSTVNQLIDIENARRSRISDILKPICLDSEALLCLKEQNIDETYTPKLNEIVRLGYASNASRGGTLRAVSPKICKKNLKILQNVMYTLNLEVAGIDLECQSLEIPLEKSGGVIIETNFSPSVRIHEDGISGAQEFVTMPIMRSFIYKHPVSYAFNRVKSIILEFLEPMQRNTSRIVLTVAVIWLLQDVMRDLFQPAWINLSRLF